MALLDIFRSQKQDEVAPSAPVNIPPLPIRHIVDNKRRLDLLKSEAHLRGTQNAHKNHDWEADLSMGTGDSIAVPGYVPMGKRRPCVSLRLGKVIVSRLTTMLFGHDRFPVITVKGDEAAEDYIREMARVSKLRLKIAEARSKGGAAGTVALSWGFANGKPVIEVHSAALMEVLEWRDYEARIPARILKIYDFRDRYFDGSVMREATFWYARYWDENTEVTWRKIPEEVANSNAWVSWESEIVQHNLGKCPVIWVQNIPDSDSVDGRSDFDGQREDFDEIDRLISATERGTIANVDPTLVINDRKRQDETVVRKGSGTVIYSPGGAAYLELGGTAVAAAKELMRELKQAELDEAEVILLDPDQLSGSGVSAASLRVRFAPMLAKCDILRDQYGDAMVSILRDMVETARLLQVVKTADDGSTSWSMVELEPRIDEVEDDDDKSKGEGKGDKKKSVRFVEVERDPGRSSRVSLAWPPYFPATWEDRRTAVETAKAASGRQVLSRETAVESLASVFDIEDAKKEVDRIEEDEEGASERAKGIMEAGAPELGLQQRKKPPKPDEEPEGE